MAANLLLKIVVNKFDFWITRKHSTGFECYYIFENCKLPWPLFDCGGVNHESKSFKELVFMKKKLLAILALACSFSAFADCTAFPVDVSVSSIDPRFNLSPAEAVQTVQASVDYINQNTGRLLVRQADNGVPISFEWNDISAANLKLKQFQDEMKSLLAQINALKQQVANNPSNNQTRAQLDELINRYNQELATSNNIRMALTTESLGTFSRVSTYAYIRIFGYDSYETLIHVLMHEMGHMLGLSHSPGYVMDPRANSSFELSPGDIAHLAAEYDSVCRR